MDWSQAYPENDKPSLEDINKFVDNNLWNELCLYLKDTYTVIPKIEYSRCSMQRGWNVKFRKNSKSLCTLYPMNGYFIALIVIGEKERMEAEFIISGCCEYIRTLFERMPYTRGSKWMMIDVKDQATLRDVKEFITLRTR